LSIFLHSTQGSFPHQEQDYAIFITQIYVLFIFFINGGTVATNPDYILVRIKGG